MQVNKNCTGVNLWVGCEIPTGKWYIMDRDGQFALRQAINCHCKLVSTCYERGLLHTRSTHLHTRSTRLWSVLREDYVCI
jgi:hypothetical protein